VLTGVVRAGIMPDIMALICIHSTRAMKESGLETPGSAGLLKLAENIKFYPLLPAMFFTCCIASQHYHQER